MHEWLSTSSFGSKGESVYLLSPDAVERIHVGLKQDGQLGGKIEPLSCTAFEKYQEYEIHPWQEIVHLVLGFILHYGDPKGVGIAFSENDFYLPQKQNGGDHSAFAAHVDAQGQYPGLQWRKRWLFEIQNMRGHFVLDEEDRFTIEPIDAVVCLHQVRRGTSPHFAIVDSQGRNFHFEPPKPNVVQWLFNSPSSFHVADRLIEGACSRPKCEICSAARQLSAAMRG